MVCATAGPTAQRAFTAEDMKHYIWLKPEIVAEIKFTERNQGGLLRHAEFVSLRQG